MTDIWKRFTDLCEEMKEDVPPSFISRRSTFKQKLSESIGDVFYFYQPLNRDIHERGMLLIPTKYICELAIANDQQQNDYTTTNASEVSNENDIMNIVHLALLSRKILSEHSEYKGLNVSKELAESVVPKILYLYLSVLMRGQEAVDEFFENNNNFDHHDYKDIDYNDIDDDDDDSDDDTDTDPDPEYEGESSSIKRINESE